MKAIDQKIVGLKAQKVKVPKNNFIRLQLDSHSLTCFITTIFQHIQAFSSTGDFSTSGIHDPRHFFKWASLSHIFSKKKHHLDRLNSKPTTSTKNGKYQLLTRMPQASYMLGGLMLIPIFVTHSL